MNEDEMPGFPQIEVAAPRIVEALPVVEGLPRLAKIHDVARALGTTTATIISLMRAEQSPRVFGLSNSCRGMLVDVDWLREWIEARRIETDAEAARRVELARASAGIRRPESFAQKLCPSLASSILKGRS